MCAQIFFVTSLRGSGSVPTILARCSEGCIGFMNALFFFALLAGFAIYHSQPYLAAFNGLIVTDLVPDVPKGIMSMQFRRNRARPLKMNERPGNNQQLQDRLEQNQLLEPCSLDQLNHEKGRKAYGVKPPFHSNFAYRVVEIVMVARSERIVTKQNGSNQLICNPFKKGVE